MGHVRNARTVELMEEFTRFILPREITVPNCPSNVVKVVKPDCEATIYRRAFGATFFASGEIDGDVPIIEYPVITVYGVSYSQRTESEAQGLIALGKARKVPKSGWQGGFLPGCSK